MARDCRRTNAIQFAVLLFLSFRPSQGEEHYHYTHHHYGPETSEHDGDLQDYEYHYHDHHYYYYGDSGSPDAYYTHGSLLLDDIDAYKEFISMDMLEACVIGVFDSVELEEESQDHAVFSELAQEYSHLMRFAHTNNPEVMAFLEMNKPGVFLYPAARLAANHPKAGARIHYPGKRLIKEALETFLFMEAAPYVGQYEWRATERAAAVNVPILVVFATVDELHHSYHHSNSAEEELADQEQYDPDAFQGGNSESKDMDAASAINIAWDFDSLAAILRTIGQAFRHDLNVLVADKRMHSYELRSYQLECTS